MPTQVDIARLLTDAAGKQLAKAFTASKERHIPEEVEASIKAIILFQTAMEAIINEEVYNHPLLQEVKSEEYALNKKYRSLSFRNKWKRSYDALQIRDYEHLDDYLRFYSHYRSPISHPRSRYVSVRKYRFKKVYPGIESGWYASQLLYAILGKELTSWDEFCSQVGLSVGN